MVLPIAVRILADVGVEKPRFIADDVGVGILELHLAGLGGLHFGAGKRNSGLVLFQQVVVEAGLPVVAQNFEAVCGISQGILISTRWKPEASLLMVADVSFLSVAQLQLG